MKLCKLLARPIESKAYIESDCGNKAGGLFSSGGTSVSKGVYGTSRQSTFIESNSSIEYGGESTEDECYDEESEEQLKKSSNKTICSSSYEYVPNNETAEDMSSRRRQSLEFSKYFRIKRRSVDWESGEAVMLELQLSVGRPSPLIEQSTCDESSRRDPAVLTKRPDSGPSKQRVEEYSSEQLGNESVVCSEPEHDRSSGEELLNKPANECENHRRRSSEAAQDMDEIFRAFNDQSPFNNVPSESITTKLQRRLKCLEKRQNIPLQRLKELLLSSKEGMQDFIAFLVPTKGITMLDFWLDCETINMNVSKQQPSKRVQVKFQLLRELEDRYALHLNPRARRHLAAASTTLANYLLPTSFGADNLLAQKIGEAMFECVQYDVLRQLRAYWLPCWLLHWETRINHCYFLPTSAGGSALFYVPSSEATSLEKWESMNYGNNSSSQSTNEFNQSFVGTTDETVDEQYELTSAHTWTTDEMDWQNEVQGRLLARALRKKGLIDVDNNRAILKDIKNQRLFRPAQSTVGTTSSQVTGSTSSATLFRAGAVNTATTAGMRRPVFNHLSLAWSIPVEMNQVLGLTRVPGSSWEALRIQELKSTGVQETQWQPGPSQDVGSKQSEVTIEPWFVSLGVSGASNELTDDPKDTIEDRTNAVKSIITIEGQEQMSADQSIKSAGKEVLVLQRGSYQLLINRMNKVILSDAAAGGPFQFFLERNKLEKLSRALGFLQAVDDFSRQSYCPTPNRLTQLAKAWHIANKFLIAGSKWDLELPLDVVQEVTNCIRLKRNQVPVCIYEKIRQRCLSLLLPAWIDFLKTDALQFARANIRCTDDTPPPESIDDFDVFFTNGDVTVVRKTPPRPDSSIKNRTKSWDSLTAEQKEYRIRLALERRRMMEYERKRALRAMKRRQKEAAEAKSRKVSPTGLRRIQHDEEEDHTTPRESQRGGGRKHSVRASGLKAFVSNKILMGHFQAWLTKQSQAQTIQSEMEKYDSFMREFSYVLEVTRLIAMPSERRKPEYAQRRAEKVDFIFKTFLSEKSPKKIFVTAKYIEKLQVEKDWPSVETLKGIREQAMQNLDKPFAEFLTKFLDVLGISVDQLAQMSEKNLALLVSSPSESDEGQKVKKHFAYRAQPTLEDQKRFEDLLARCAFKPLTFEVVLFYQYLVDSEKRGGNKFIDQDLIFYIEVLRFQELCRGNAPFHLVKQKVNCILMTYIESVFPPKVQVNLPDDVSRRLSQKIGHNITSKSIRNVNFFDEPMRIIFRELLPYWAGFCVNVLYPPKSARQVSHTSTDRSKIALEIPWLSAPLSYKSQELLSRRLIAYNQWSDCAVDYKLPRLPKNVRANIVTFSIKDGISWKYGEQTPT
ncbi:unnamed protein product [Calicophoron daubneyi]|uniref:RGS domain-containing protein n=1 Tax=Calicophoron daubneyi TaxID=300641 RepID=A0AAV2TQ36_CALDB